MNRTKKVLIALALLLHAGLTWVWLLGGLAPPPDVAAQFVPSVQRWFAPGVLLFPAMVSMILLVVGAGMLASAFTREIPK